MAGGVGGQKERRKKKKEGGTYRKGLHSNINEMKEREREKGERWGEFKSRGGEEEEGLKRRKWGARTKAKKEVKD